jgi:hypothetical protein
VSRHGGQLLLRTLKEGRNSLRCTMGRANAAGACTSRMLTATGYALFTCPWYKMSDPHTSSNVAPQPFTLNGATLKTEEKTCRRGCAVRWDSPARDTAPQRIGTAGSGLG